MILRETIALPFDYDAVVVEENPDYTEDACNGPAWQATLRDGKYGGVGRTRDEAIESLRDNLKRTATFVGRLCAEQIVPEDVMPKINGVSFKCPCGCNVFRHPWRKPTVYVCNGCGDRFRGES